MKKIVILMTTLCLIVIFGLPSPAIALQNENIISVEEQEAIEKFYTDLEDAYEAINQGEGGYYFYNLNAGEMVTYDLLDLFEYEFENHQYDEIRQYCNENQIAIVKGYVGNSIMPFACIGDGCSEGSPVIKAVSNTFTKRFINRYYLEELGQTVHHTATVFFSAKYLATAGSSSTFMEWIQSSNYLSCSINSDLSIDGVRLSDISIDLDDATKEATATFTLYSKTVVNDPFVGSVVHEYFICEGEIILTAS